MNHFVRFLFSCLLIASVVAIFAAAGCTCVIDDDDEEDDEDDEEEDLTCDEYETEECRELAEDGEAACMNVCANHIETTCDYDECVYGYDGCMVRKYYSYVQCAITYHCEEDLDYVLEPCFLECHKERGLCVDEICATSVDAHDFQCFQAFDECKSKCWANEEI